MKQLKPRVGDLEDIDLSWPGLERWEVSIQWQQFAAPDLTILLTRIYLVMGQMLSSLGRYQEAIVVLSKGLSHAEGRMAPDLAQQATSLLQLARMTAYLERGDFAEAEAALNELALEKSPLTPAVYARQLELAAKLDFLRGRFGTAVQKFEEVIQFCRERMFVRASAIAMLNLAHTFVLLNRVGDALNLVQEARHSIGVQGDLRFELRADAITSLALARRRSSTSAISIALSVMEMYRPRRSMKAEQLQTDLPPSFPSLPQDNDFLSFFEDRALEFEWVLGVDVDDAAHRLSDIQQTFSHTDSHLIQVRIRVLQALLDLVGKRYDTAMMNFERAAVDLTELSLMPELWQVVHLRARCLEHVGRSAEAAGLSETAERLLLRMSHSLDGSDRAIFLLNKATVEEQHIERLVHELVQDQERVAAASGIAKLLGRLRLMRHIHNLMAHVDLHKAGLADRHVGETKLDSSAQGQLPDGTFGAFLRRLLCVPRDHAILSFLVLPGSLVVLSARFLHLGFSIIPITRLDIRERVRRWHELMQSAGSGLRRDLISTGEVSLSDGTSDPTTITDLVQGLQLDEILSLLPKEISKLSIVPDDILHGVPFAAMKYEGRYLIERFALSVRFSTQLSDTVARNCGQYSLVIGVSRSVGNLPPLPKVRLEVDAVSKWLRDRGAEHRVLMDMDANRDAVLSGLSESMMTHIACHGTFDPEHPDQSGLLLLDQNGEPDRVTLRDIAMLRLNHCQLVTLSSCWSADNFILPGRWIISLPETLWRSGAQSVVGSLWQVDDDVASAFMAQFYTNLERMPRDAALRETQLAALKNDFDSLPNRSLYPVDTRDPFFWSGFVLYGETGVVRV